MSTPISEFYEPVRAFLGDFNTTVRRYQDTSILAVVKALVRGGRLNANADGITYTLTVDNLSITPLLDNPNTWMLMVYKACAVFAYAGGDAYSYKTRAISESFGESRQLIHSLESGLHELENGTMFASWQSLSGWAAGLTGLDFWSHMSQLTFTAPVQTLSVSQSGIS